MSTDLKEFGRMDATGIERKGEDKREGEGVLGQRRPASIVATGTRDNSIRKGMSLGERSKGSR
jgi:hypothetical protein